MILVPVNQENSENLAIQSYKGPGPEGCTIFLKNLKRPIKCYTNRETLCVIVKMVINSPRQQSLLPYNLFKKFKDNGKVNLRVLSICGYNNQCWKIEINPLS